MQGDGAEVLIEHLDGSLEIRGVAPLDLVARLWSRIERAIEGEPCSDDMVLEFKEKSWFGYHWSDCDVPVLALFHDLETIVPAAHRWLEAHNLKHTGNIWIKEGGFFGLLELD